MSRGLNVGLFSVASCLINALKVPIVPLNHLRCFFSVEEVWYICDCRVEGLLCPLERFLLSLVMIRARAIWWYLA